MSVIISIGYRTISVGLSFTLFMILMKSLFVMIKSTNARHQQSCWSANKIANMNYISNDFILVKINFPPVSK